MEVAVQALVKAEELHLECVEFECDSTGVVFVLQGMQEYGDWQDADTVSLGRTVLSRHPLWNFRFINRECNRSAHNIAQWAKQSEFSGYVNLHILPCFVFCEGGDVSVNSTSDDNIAG